MSLKEYETLQPVPSQAERDLAFMDASLSVADYSNADQVRTAKRLRKRDWFGFKMNGVGRLFQAAIVSCFCLLGFLIALLILNIPLKMSPIVFLMKYGYTGPYQGVQVIHFEGQRMTHPYSKQLFQVSALIYNFDSGEKVDQNFSFQIFSPTGEPLDNQTFQCCSPGIPSKTKVEIVKDFIVPSSPMGYFEVKSF